MICSCHNMQVIAINQDQLGIAGDIIWKVKKSMQLLCVHACFCVGCRSAVLMMSTFTNYSQNKACHTYS